MGDVLGHLARVAQGTEVISGGVFEGAAFSEDEFLGKLIEGTVRRELVADPASENPDALLAQILGVALKQIRELVGPKFRIGG